MPPHLPLYGTMETHKALLQSYPERGGHSQYRGQVELSDEGRAAGTAFLHAE